MKATDIVLPGDRVFLRQIRSTDKELYYSAGFGEVDEEVAYYTGSTGSITKAETDAYIDRVVTDESRYDFLIFDQYERLLGEVVINHIELAGRIASFRVCVFRSHNCNLGIGTEAIGLILEFAFEQLGLHRVELEVYDYNQRARHVYANLGFVQEGVKRDAVFANGKYHDVIIMGILESDYRGKRA